MISSKPKTVSCEKLHQDISPGKTSSRPVLGEVPQPLLRLAEREAGAWLLGGLRELLFPSRTCSAGTSPHPWKLSPQSAPPAQAESKGTLSPPSPPASIFGRVYHAEGQATCPGPCSHQGWMPCRDSTWSVTFLSTQLLRGVLCCVSPSSHSPSECAPRPVLFPQVAPPAHPAPQ